ncbi:MAG TPA: hypothetical protein VF077_00300 [Nitrospiraceae bacterium]
MTLLLVLALALQATRPAPPSFEPAPAAQKKKAPEPPTQVRPAGKPAAPTIVTPINPPEEPSPGAKAPPGKQATLRWKDNNEPNPADSFVIWRSNGECGPYPPLAKIKTGVKTSPYVDGTIQPNKAYCYAVSSVYKGEESAQSLPVTATPPRASSEHGPKAK